MLLLSSWWAGAGNRSFFLNPHSKTPILSSWRAWAGNQVFFFKPSFKRYIFWAPGRLGLEFAILLIIPYLRNATFELLAGWAGNRDILLNLYLKNIPLSSWRAGAGNRDFLLNVYFENINFHPLAGWGRKSWFSIKFLFRKYYFLAPGGLGPMARFCFKMGPI